jgi:ABC-type transport system involved in multi-copper enzyme maturation permease subunit
MKFISTTFEGPDKMLLPLLWKDLRLNKYVILLTVFFVDTPYLTTALGLSAFTGEPEDNTPLTERLSIAFPFSLLFLAIVSAFIGGYPITAEKAERTDRFLDYLPPTRLQVVTSKVLIALSLLLLAWIGPTIVYFEYVRPTAVGGMMREGSRFLILYALSTSLILFGLAWLASLYIRSSTLCGLAAFVGWLAVLIIVRRISFALRHGHTDNAHMVDGLLWVAIGIVVSSLAAGILLFLRTPSD